MVFLGMTRRTSGLNGQEKEENLRDGWYIRTCKRRTLLMRRFKRSTVEDCIHSAYVGKQAFPKRINGRAVSRSSKSVVMVISLFANLSE